MKICNFCGKQIAVPCSDILVAAKCKLSAKVSAARLNNADRRRELLQTKDKNAKRSHGKTLHTERGPTRSVEDQMRGLGIAYS